MLTFIFGFGEHRENTGFARGSPGGVNGSSGLGYKRKAGYDGWLVTDVPRDELVCGSLFRPRGRQGTAPSMTAAAHRLPQQGSQEARLSAGTASPWVPSSCTSS